MTMLAFGAFIPRLQPEFQWGIPKIAVSASIMSIMILSPVQGLLVDRFGGRRIVQFSIPAFATSLCGLYWLPNDPNVFYAASMIIAVCAIGVWPVSSLHRRRIRWWCAWAPTGSSPR